MIKIQNTFKANGCLCPKSDTVICHNCHILITVFTKHIKNKGKGGR